MNTNPIMRGNTIKKKQHGLTLLEAMAWLSIAGVVIAGALVMQNSAQSGATANREVADIASTKLVIQKKAMGTGRAYTKLDNDGVAAASVMAQLSASGALSTGFASCAANICTYPNGDTLTYSSAAGKFTLTFSSTESKNCQGVADQLLSVSPTNTPTCAAATPFTLAMDFK